MTHQTDKSKKIEEFDEIDGPMIRFSPEQVHLIGLELRPNRSLQLLVTHLYKDVPETSVSIWFDDPDLILPNDLSYELASFEENLELIDFPKEVSVNPRDFLKTPNHKLGDLVDFVLTSAVIPKAQLVVVSRDHALYAVDHPVFSLFEGKKIDDWTVDGYHPELDIGFFLMLGDCHISTAARSVDMPFVFNVIPNHYY